MIESVTANGVLAGCRHTLGLSDQDDAGIDDVLVAALLRRSAGVHCPCSQATLRSSVLECTKNLAADEIRVRQLVDDTIEALTVGGDLLELNDVVTEDVDIRQTWVFAAPPGFVIRPNGTAFVFGVVPDQDTFLPPSLGARVLYDGFTRSMEPQEGEDLASKLREQGLQELSESVWLKSPKSESSDDLLARADMRLSRQTLSTTIDGLKILDSVRPTTYYPDRWVVPQDQTGMFIARRPQEFGAPMWCLVRLQDGTPTRLLDLPFEKTRWRSCDAAWHLQMAIDHCRRHPQQYRRRKGATGVRFDFFGPLPQWAQRRLVVFGERTTPEQCLLSYLVPSDRAETEDEFLRRRLWLSPIEGSE